MGGMGPRWVVTPEATTTTAPAPPEPKTLREIGEILVFRLAAGAAIGQAIGRDTKGTLIGAAAGALLGGIAGHQIGSYMDAQEAKLREQLQGTGVQVVREGDNIRLVMPGNITFDTNSGHVKSSFYEVLNSVAVVLEEFDKTIIAVSGHTDSTGSESYNQSLSEQRAASVSQFLESRGVGAALLSTFGEGEANPVADNKTREGRAMNRRVDILISGSIVE